MIVNNEKDKERLLKRFESYMTIKLPDIVADKRDCKVYKLLDTDGMLLAVFERMPNEYDIISVDGTSGIYYGEWARWSADKVYDYNVSANFIKERATKTAQAAQTAQTAQTTQTKMSARDAARIHKEKELAEAEALLAHLRNIAKESE